MFYSFMNNIYIYIYIPILNDCCHIDEMHRENRDKCTGLPGYSGLLQLVRVSSWKCDKCYLFMKKEFSSLNRYILNKIKIKPNAMPASSFD